MSLSKYLSEREVPKTGRQASVKIPAWRTCTNAVLVLHGTGGSPVLAINSADDVMNPPELGLMEQLMLRVRNGRYVLIPTSEETRGHGTHSLPRCGAPTWRPS